MLFFNLINYIMCTVQIIRKTWWIKIGLRYFSPIILNIYRNIASLAFINFTDVLWTYAFCSIFGYFLQCFFQVFICFFRQQLLIPPLVEGLCFTTVLQTLTAEDAFKDLAPVLHTVLKEMITPNPNLGVWYHTPCKETQSYEDVTPKLQRKRK